MNVFPYTTPRPYIWRTSPYPTITTPNTTPPYLGHFCSTRNRDFVWVDFQGVGSDMEGISRAVYQLGLRQVGCFAFFKCFCPSV